MDDVRICAASESVPPAKGLGVIRVVVVTEVRILREGLQQAIDRRQGCDVVGTAASATQAIQEITARRPDIVLADSTLARQHDFAKSVIRASPLVKIVAFAVGNGEEEILACAEAGALGYVLQQASLAELIGTLKAVMRGELICPPRIAARAFQRISTLASGTRRQPTSSIGLPPRQIEILTLIEEGFSNKEIARALHLAPSTVKNHVHSILTRMGVARRTQAVAQLRRGNVAAASAVPGLDISI